MIKLAFPLHRRSEMTREEFQAYWRGTHAELVAKHAPLLGIKRYVQLHTRTTGADEGLRASRGAPEPFDGIAELWFESEAAIAESFRNPDAAAAGQELIEDERRFVDLERSPIWLGEENEVVPFAKDD
jgi:uncharacterized protein (TIGR02118 family)